MSPEPAVYPVEKTLSQQLLIFGGDQRVVSSLRGISQAAAKVFVTKAGEEQAFLVATGAWGQKGAQSASAAYEQIARELKKRNLQILHERVFGSLAAWHTVRSVRRRVFQSQGLETEGPFTYIQGFPPWGKGLSGVIIRAVQKREHTDQIWTIRYQGWPVGRGWRRQGHTTLILQNIQGLSSGSNGWNCPPLQVRQLLATANHILREQGASYRDVVRTWFYLNDILPWYADFNQARSAAYQELGLMAINGGGHPRLPASTGIQGEAAGGVACSLDLLAVARSPESRPRVKQLHSPAQPEALSYGSAFSRGMIIRQPDVSLIQVSGTAAIDEHGQSLYPGDVRAQIDCTFDKIAALLGQEGAALEDIAAASVFIKRPADALVYQERAAARGLENLPAVVMVADICRPELLFEIDAEVALKPGRTIHEEKQG